LLLSSNVVHIISHLLDFDVVIGRKHVPFRTPDEVGLDRTFMAEQYRRLLIAQSNENSGHQCQCK